MEAENLMSFIKKHKLLFICIPIILAVTIAAIVGYLQYERGKKIDSLLGEGNRYMSKLDYEQAIAIYRQTLDIDEKNFDARMGIAECYSKLGQSEYAIDEYRSIISARSNSPEPYIKLSELYIARDELSEAKEVIEAGFDRVKNDPDLSELYLISHPAPPTADVASGSYSERQAVTLSAEDGNAIYYTINGSEPTSDDRLYDKSLILRNGESNIRAIAYNNAGFYSEVADFNYKIDIADEVITIQDNTIDRLVRSENNLLNSEDVSNDDIAQITELYIIGDWYYSVRLNDTIIFSDGVCYINGRSYTTNRHGSVKTLADVENMPYLETLVVAYQEKLDLSDFKAPSSLKRLSLIGNGLTSDSLKYISGISGLEELCLGWNSIDDISELKKLGSLSSLGLWGNRIKDISPISGLDKLEYLDFSSNNVSDISSISKLGELRELWMYNNSVSKLEPVSKLPRLSVLMLSNNPISDPESIKEIYPRLTRIDEDLLGLGKKEGISK